MGRGSPLNLYSIPPSAPFLPTFVDHLLAGRFGPLPADPAAIADTLILLPTRRAARTLTALLSDAAPDGATILPTIRAIGDVDEDALLFGTAETDFLRAADVLVETPALSPVERHLVLTDLVLAFGRGIARELSFPGADEHVLIPLGASDAARLAQDLGRLLDGLAIEEIDPATIRELIPDQFAGYWSITLRFLEIILQQWPAYLAERGMLDPADRRSRLIRAEAARLRATQPSAPVIAAGSTGSVPATADLLATIARLDNGAVVLPGVDFDLEAPSWAALGGSDNPVPGHPQYGLSRLVRSIGATREDIAPVLPEATMINRSRERLISEALRPAETTDLWRDLSDRFSDTLVDDATDGMALIVAANPRLEALAIAVAIREAIATEASRVALVTPDRQLSRSVVAELGRWGIDAVDTAGLPLGETETGRLMRVIADAAARRLAPVDLAAVLTHPLARLGAAVDDYRRHAEAIEIAVLRGPRPRPGSAGLRAAFEVVGAGSDRHAHPALQRLSPDDLRAAGQHLDRLIDAFAPFESLAPTSGAVPVRALVAAQIAVAEALTTDDQGEVLLGDGGGGQELVAHLDAVLDASDTRLRLALADWPSFLSTLLAMVPAYPADPGRQVQIWGPLEARLQDADLLILAGLNEDVWPREPRIDPWLNRPMRQTLGLPLPERQIGLSAHDFAQGLAAKRVLLTRSEKTEDGPAVASRWLQRLEAVIGSRRAEILADRGQRYLDWARAIDAPPADVPPTVIVPPAPRPPRNARPSRFSVTEIETLIRDPYAIYAKRVLGLIPLDPLDAAPDARLRGVIVHDILAKYVDAFRDGVPEDGAARLVGLAEAALAHIDDRPEIQALWRPRFRRMAGWFFGFERDWGETSRNRFTECAGQIDIRAGESVFTLTGRADRIDLTAEGRLAVFDYKTGQAPSAAQVVAGFQPQLTLEAAMALRGAFPDLPAPEAISGIERLTYLRLTGGLPPGEIRDVTSRDGLTLDALVAAHWQGLERLLTAYADPDRAFLSKPRVAFRAVASDYDHLARFAEWRDAIAPGGILS